jgi:hypothetical protein
VSTVRQIYRLALRAYPAPFLDEHEQEMVLLFINRWRRETSIWQRILLSMQSLADIALGARQRSTTMCRIGPSIRVAYTGQVACLCLRSHRDHFLGHRRNHHDVQRRPCRNAPPLAIL